MNLDELPIEVLFALVLLGWAGYFTLIAWERCRNRAHGRDDRVLDHEVQNTHTDRSTDDPDHEGAERFIAHARSVHGGRDR